MIPATTDTILHRPAELIHVGSASFETDPNCLVRLRGWVRARLRHTPYAADLTPVLVGVNELATNSLQHSRSGRPGGSFAVFLTWSPAVLRVTVTDTGGDTLPTVSPPSEDRESGRGLQLLAAMVDRWGFQQTAHGCEVWFEHKAPIGVATVCTAQA